MKLEALESDYLYIENSQIINAGKGLFTAINIFPNEIISIFNGEKLSEKEANKRAIKGLDKYFMIMPDGTTFDAMRKMCYAKYANDAEAYTKLEFKNNSKITLDEDNNVCLIATKKIKSGDEIFCSYGAKYWKKHF